MDFRVMKESMFHLVSQSGEIIRQWRFLSLSPLSLPFTFVLSALLLAVPCDAQQSPGKNSSAYALGVLPYLVPRNMAALYGPAAVDMGNKLGKRVSLRTAGSFDRYRENLRQQIYDIAIIQPFDYPLAVDELGYLPLVQVDRQLQAVVVVLDDSPVQELKQLAGERVVMAPRHAATSHQGVWALKQAGLTLGEDLDVDFLTTHDACLHEILVGAAAACITGPPPLKDFTERTGVKMRVVLRTPPIPHVLTVVHPRVLQADREALERIMVEWAATEDGRAILEPMRFPGWVKARPQDYAVMREYLEADAKDIVQAKGDGELVFASFPYFQPKALVEQLAVVTHAFAAALDRPVHFRTAPSYERFQQNLGHAQYDIALIRPYDYQTAVNSGYAPLARVKEDLSAFVYVRKESKCRTLQDLKGKRVATPPASAVMTQLGREHLKKNGLVPGVNVELVHRKGHGSCVQQVEQNLAEACITHPIALHAIYGKDPDELRLLAQTPPVPSILFVMHERQPAALHRKLTATILNWNDSQQGTEVFKKSGLGPFSKVNVADYEAFSTP